MAWLGQNEHGQSGVASCRCHPVSPESSRPPRISTFIVPESMPATGHYTEAGNEWVAEDLYDYLMQIPDVQALLATTGT